MKAIRVNDDILPRVIGSSPAKEFWLVVESYYASDPLAWPADVVKALMTEEQLWKDMEGPLEILSRQYACARHAGHSWCVMRVIYARVKEQPSVTPAAAVATDGSAVEAIPASEAVRSFSPSEQEIPGKFEMYEGRLRKVVDGSRSGWWRFHEHYDRDGYCDNPARGY